MAEKTGRGVLQHMGGAGPGTEATGGPSHLMPRQARNVLDQAKGSPPDAGVTKGQHQVGRRGSNSAKE